MIYAGSGNIPKHVYCFVDSSFIRKRGAGFEPCVWFAINSTLGRMWGCHVMLECGAVYRNVPPHALAFKKETRDWQPHEAQVWNCYGNQFSVVTYDFLAELKIDAGRLGKGVYLFTAIPLNDAYSAEPTQAKEFMFCKLDNGRLTILPTNKLLFEDASFTSKTDWPKDLKLLSTVWSVE